MFAKCAVSSSILTVLTAGLAFGSPDLPSMLSVRLTAQLVSLPTGAPERRAIEIVVTRWSHDVETDRLASLITEHRDVQAAAMKDLPAVGHLRMPDGTTYGVRFASTWRDDHGVERIFLATDCPFGSARPRNETAFTVIELRINPDGQGEGRSSIAAEVTVDKKDRSIGLADYGSQPVLLQSVRRMPGTN